MATIRDIAEKVGVTATTVSRVINNRGYISEETRQKVYAAMEELNYKPNELARSLSKSRSDTIGLIVPHIYHPFFAKLISCMEAVASEKKYKLLVCNSKEKPEKEEEYLNMCLSNRVTGIVICSKNIDTSRFKMLGIPIINLERTQEAQAATIQCDNYQGGCLAAKCLIEAGCKNLLHFGGVIGREMPADMRAAAFTKVCEDSGVASTVLLSDAPAYGSMNYRNFIRDALEKHPHIDGIFASSDLIAAQVIQICQKLGLSVPGQMKVVGFDDVLVSELATPAITTIHQPVKEMARLAVEFIDRSLNGEIVPTSTVLPVRLVRRDSV